MPIVNRDGKPVAEWRGRDGKKRSAQVTVSKAGTQRIRQKASTYTAKYRAADGSTCLAATGCRDKQAAQAVLNELVARETLILRKIMTAEQADIADYQETSIEGHIADFLEYHRRKKTHPGRVKTYETRLKESATGCGFRRLCDLSSDRLERWLSEQVEGDRKMGASVYNGFVEGWINFGNWCIGKRGKGKRSHFNGEKRLQNNPFQGMYRMDEQADRRRKARALTEHELVRLLTVARQRPLDDALTIRRGKNKGKLLAKVSEKRRAELIRTGHERALIYKTAVTTGLRKNELGLSRCMIYPSATFPLSSCGTRTKRVVRDPSCRCDPTWLLNFASGPPAKRQAIGCSMFPRGCQISWTATWRRPESRRSMIRDMWFTSMRCGILSVRTSR